MKRCKFEYQYDGHFAYQGREILYNISDDKNANKSIKDGKMLRCIHFYESDTGNNLGMRAIYGYDEEMTNITSERARQWFEEYKGELVK